MDAQSAIVLAIVQAVTEFLPVSSSGHLRLTHAAFGASAEEHLLYDIVLHVGTLLAVVVVYRLALRSIVHDVFAGTRALFGEARVGLRAALEAYEGLRVAALICIATLPTAIIGLLLSRVLRTDALGVEFVGGLLLLNGVMLYASRYVKGVDGGRDRGPLSVAGIGWREALLVGVAQGIAVLPGISRSGATIVCALALGADRMRAAQFSFLLSIPAIIGAVILEFDAESLGASDGGWWIVVAGGLVAAIVGYFALRLLLNLLRRAKFYHFAWYCWLVGGGALLWWWTTRGAVA